MKNILSVKKIDFSVTFRVQIYIYIYTQSDSGEIFSTLGNDSMCDSKQKSSYEHGSALNGYRDMVKRRYGPSCEHKQQLRNK